MSETQYDRLMARINDVLCAVNVLQWDARTYMPMAGAAARAAQIATLTGLARDLATGEAFRAALDAALDDVSGEPTQNLRRRAVEMTRDSVAMLRRIPAPLVVEAADLRTRAQAAWVEARARNDFDGFAPMLERTIELARGIGQAMADGGHPYDALLGLFEPGMTSAHLDTIYAELRTGLRPLLDRALGLPPVRRDFLLRTFPVDGQKAFARSVAARLGYDFSRGRLDDTAHPFEISLGRNDVRITGRFNRTFLPAGFFGVWHEAGHGLYEQNVDPAFARTVFATDLVGLYAVGGASFGMHESQSRLLENRVGRSRRFWALHFSELREAFPEALADVDTDAFWRAVNAPLPGLIRVEADELTYDFHIMLRTELEAGLIEGALHVRDLPAAWAERMKAELGVVVKDYRDGVLQDVHWPSGLFGSFPTYTLGNIMGSQFFAAACAEPNVSDGLDGGDYAPLAAWLARNVHCHGRSLTPDAILRGATGSHLDPAPYLADLEAKVVQLAAA